MPLLFEPWLKFKHPLVRQLAFSIASPNILRHIPKALPLQHGFELHSDDFWQQQYESFLPRLKQLDTHPDELIHFIQQLKSTRLGLRFEYLMWFWLQDPAQTQFDIIGHSIQVIDGPRTVGELDFVLWNHAAQRVEHWEVALKFYLAEHGLNFIEWYGLNRSDTLKRKLNHFTQKQFQFDHALEHPINCKFAVLKGQLYLPLSYKKALAEDQFETSQMLPEWINPQRRIGFWGEHILPSFYRLQRQEWICPEQNQSSPDAIWWCNGLYTDHKTKEFYMFRQAKIHPSCVIFM